MPTLTLLLSDIWPGDRLRDVDTNWSTTLAASIAEQAQMTRIEVRATPDTVRPYALVAGAHRLRAVEMLGWEGSRRSRAASRPARRPQTRWQSPSLHRRLHPDARRRLTGTWLADHGQQLDLLASCKCEEQLAALHLLFGEVEAGFERPKNVGDCQLNQRF